MKSKFEPSERITHTWVEEYEAGVTNTDRPVWREDRAKVMKERFSMGVRPYVDLNVKASPVLEKLGIPPMLRGVYLAALRKIKKALSTPASLERKTKLAQKYIELYEVQGLDARKLTELVKEVLGIPVGGGARR